MALNVAIIGGGVAGLSLGTYLQLNGFETEIFEKQDFPGGVCTSWQRKGFLIDGGIRSMVGTKPSNDFHTLWNDVVDLEDMEFHYPEAHFEIEDGEGRRLVFYSDLEKLEAELLDKCSSDKKAIRSFIQTAHKYEHFCNFSDKPPQLMKTSDQASLLNRMLPRLFSWTGLTNTSNRDYSERFSDPLLKRCFTEGFDADLPVMTSILQVAWANDKEVGYPIGGGVFIARRLEKKYLELGGTVHYNRKVDKVLIEDDKATGVACCDGEAFYADLVVSAADGHTSFYHMLERKYIDKAAEERYESDSFETTPPLLVYSVGLNADMSKYPQRLIFPVKDNLSIDPKTTIDHLDITNFSHDPVAAPSGKSLLTFTTPAYDWQWWINARKNDRPAYNSRKKKLAEEITHRLDVYFGNISDNLEMVNIATPATFHRYTNNWKGAPMGWMPSAKLSGKKPQYEIEGLKDFYLTGQWAYTGGLHNVVLSANHVAQLICDRFNLEFNTKPLA